MPKIPQEKIDEIRQSVDIVDVIGQYVPLTRKGSNYRGLCPFHDDNDPSLTVSPRRQIYRCFACGQGGNVFTFLQEYLHIPFMEALKQVAELGGVDVRAYDLSSRVETVNVKLKPYYDMHEEAEKIYAYYLNTKPATLARDYLAQRGFNEEIIETFKIGYAPAKSILF
ncbi:MAG: CHC2 zinc finger domain-containing protein, partial [bacterium]